MAPKFSLIMFFTLSGNVLLPLYATVVYLSIGDGLVDLIFVLCVCALLIERAWETFRTTRERKRDKFQGDWTLAAVTATYLALFFLLITEFYFFVDKVNIWVSFLGLVLWLISTRLRFWGMAALGKQWAVHAVGAQKIKKIRLIKLGPYRYIRHPIYLGIMFEVVSFPTAANTLVSLLFALLVCLPLIVKRAFTEEKSSVRRFGNKYLDYKRQVGAFAPVQFFRRSN